MDGMCDWATGRVCPCKKSQSAIASQNARRRNNRAARTAAAAIAREHGNEAARKAILHSPPSKTAELLREYGLPSSTALDRAVYNPDPEPIATSGSAPPDNTWVESMPHRIGLRGYLRHHSDINDALQARTTVSLTEQQNRLVSNIDACIAANPNEPQTFYRSMANPYPRRHLSLTAPVGTTLDVPGYVTAAATPSDLASLSDDHIVCEFVTSRYAPLPNDYDQSVLARNTRWRVLEVTTAAESPHGRPTLRLTDEPNTARRYTGTPEDDSADAVIQHYGFDISNNDAHHEKIAERCTPWAENLTHEQRSTLALYGGVVHDDINKLCYDADAVGPAFRREAEQAIPHLDAALAAAPPLPEGTTVWRGVWGPAGDPHSTSAQWATEAFPAGSTLELQSYSSTTTDKRIATSFASSGNDNAAALFVMKPTIGAYTGDAGDEENFGGLGRRSREAEVLLPRNTRWRIVGHDRDHYPPLVFCVPEDRCAQPSTGRAPAWGGKQPTKSLAL